MKFTNVISPDEHTVEVDRQGSWMTSEAALVEYSFAAGDLKLTIEGYYFRRDCIDELINFLKFAKTKVST
jgi:hypothetical protein